MFEVIARVSDFGTLASTVSVVSVILAWKPKPIITNNKE
jgi:hypothetical protein